MLKLGYFTGETSITLTIKEVAITQFLPSTSCVFNCRVDETNRYWVTFLDLFDSDDELLASFVDNSTVWRTRMVDQVCGIVKTVADTDLCLVAQDSKLIHSQQTEQVYYQLEILQRYSKFRTEHKHTLSMFIHPISLFSIHDNLSCHRDHRHYLPFKHLHISQVSL